MWLTEPKIIKCSETGCIGDVTIAKGTEIMVKTGAIGNGNVRWSCAYKCSHCGRLYWDNETATDDYAGNPGFIYNGRPGIKKDGKFIAFER